MIKLIIGLGNIGKKYEATRHNAGFWLVDALADQLEAGEWRRDKKLNAIYTEARLDGKKMVLAKPTTLMNLSGAAAQALVKKLKLQPENILVACDDLNLDLGKARLRRGGQSGGHNGVVSVVNNSGEECWRLRIGIGFNNGMVSEKYVLILPSADERRTIDATIDQAVEYLIKSGIERPEEITIS